MSSKNADWDDDELEDLEDEDFEDDEQPSQPRRRRRSTSDATGDATGGVIPYKNPPALIAYYCGVFSLLPLFGFFLGAAGFILGIKGLKLAKAHPEVRGQVHAWIGVLVGGLFALVWGAAIVMIVVGIVMNASR
jgi:hypothetical protein